MSEAGEWIEHDGGPMPVPGETKVDVRFADQSIEVGYAANTWGAEFDALDDWWSHKGHRANHIIAWRLAE